MQISDQDLDALLRHEAPHSLSIYLPLDATRRRHENWIRWKNAVREATSDNATPADTLADLEGLLTPLLNRPAAGGVLALSGGPHRLLVPLNPPVKELVVVAERFHLTPLLESVQEDLRFHLVILTHAHVRLFRGAQGLLQELELPADAPNGVQDVRPEGLDERRIQMHSGDNHGRTPIMHGQGLGEYRQDADRKRFLQRLDVALRPLLDNPDVSLVVCGDERLLHVFRQETTHAHRIALELPCNPEHAGARALYERVEAGLRAKIDVERQALLAQVGEAAHGGRVQSDLSDLLPAAEDGRIEMLLLTRGAACWGRYDAQRRSVTLEDHKAPPNEDLLNRATLRTLQHRGKLVTVEPGTLPDDTDAIGLLRY